MAHKNMQMDQLPGPTYIKVPISLPTKYRLFALFIQHRLEYKMMIII